MHFKDRLRQILSVKESPHRIATAFAFGVFIGMSPLLGIHTLLGLFFAWIFRLNRIITLIGVYITNPWTIVPIYTFGTWVGARVMGIENIIPYIDWSNITFIVFMENFRPLILPFITGTILTGFVSAVISYFIIYMSVKKYRE